MLDVDGDGAHLIVDADTRVLARGIHDTFTEKRALVGDSRDEKIFVVLSTLADVARNNPSHLSYVGDFWVAFCLGSGRSYKKETLDGYRSSITTVLSETFERHGLGRDLAKSTFRNYKTNVNTGLQSQAQSGRDAFKTVGANAEVAFSFDEYTALCDALVQQPENHFFYVLTVLLGNLGCRPSDLDTTSITDLGAMEYVPGARSHMSCSMYSLKGRWTKDHALSLFPDQNDIARSPLFALSLGLSLFVQREGADANDNFVATLFHSMLVRRVQSMGKTHRKATVTGAMGCRKPPTASTIDKPFKEVLRRELTHDQNKNLYSLRKYVQTDVRARLYVYGLANALDARAGWVDAVGDSSLKARYVQPHDDADKLVAMAAACRLPGTDQADYMTDFAWAHTSHELKVSLVRACFTNGVVEALGGVESLMPHAMYMLLGLALIKGIDTGYHPFNAPIFSRPDVVELLGDLERLPLQAMPNWGLLYHLNMDWTDYRCVDGIIVAPKRQVEEMVCVMQRRGSVEEDNVVDNDEQFWSEEEEEASSPLSPSFACSNPSFELSFAPKGS